MFLPFWVYNKELRPGRPCRIGKGGGSPPKAISKASLGCLSGLYYEECAPGRSARPGRCHCAAWLKKGARAPTEGDHFSPSPSLPNKAGLPYATAGRPATI